MYTTVLLCICIGPDRGVCKCGKDDDDVCDCRCECSDKWEGSSCDCLKGDENCNNTKGEKCSHHGVCECNKCTCWPGYDDDLWCEECSVSSYTQLLVFPSP